MTIMLNKTKVTFKLDTQAEATAISAETYHKDLEKYYYRCIVTD